MKKQIILNALAMMVTVSIAAPSFAAPSARIGTREALTDYTVKTKEAAFGKAGTAQGLSGQKVKAVQDRFVAKFGLDGISNKLSAALSDKAYSAQRLDALASIYAAKTLSEGLMQSNAVEGVELSQTATTLAKFIANSPLIGARKSSTLLKSDELADATAMLRHMETMSDSILVKMEKVERAPWIAIMKRHAELLETTQKSSEEALLQAVMEVKKADREKAVSLLRQLKECA